MYFRSHSVTDEVINAKFEEGEFTMMSEPFIQATLEGGDLQADSKEQGYLLYKAISCQCPKPKPTTVTVQSTHEKFFFTRKTTQNTVSEEETNISDVGITNSVEEEQEETSESKE